MGCDVRLPVAADSPALSAHATAHAHHLPAGEAQNDVMHSVRHRQPMKLGCDRHDSGRVITLDHRLLRGGASASRLTDAAWPRH